MRPNRYRRFHPAVIECRIESEPNDIVFFTEFKSLLTLLNKIIMSFRDMRYLFDIIVQEQNATVFRKKHSNRITCVMQPVWHSDKITVLCSQMVVPSKVLLRLASYKNEDIRWANTMTSEEGQRSFINEMSSLVRANGNAKRKGHPAVSSDLISDSSD